MNATNYHNDYAKFDLGQTVSHVTYDGEIIPATISGFSYGLMELTFPDGETGFELPSTCF